MASLFFYKRIILQSKLDPEKARQFIHHAIDDPHKNEEIEKLVADGMQVRMNLNDKDFEVRIKYVIKSMLQRQGFLTVMKGNIREKNDGKETIIKITVTLLTGHALLLGFIFLVLFAALFYSISKNKADLLFVASLLTIFWYTGSLLYFNSLVKKYIKVVIGCFANPKYHFSHLS